MANTWPGWQNAGLIGEGSFGRVYKIRREEFGQTYEAALKVITIPASQADVRTAYEEGMDEASVTRYFRSFVEEIVAEFALMSELKGNSNIVSYEDHMVVEHEDGIGWDILIRMELLTALPDYAAKHPLMEADVIRLGTDLSRALELCRRRGIVHRDIKPENIFVSANGDFKLGDFGVARVAEKTVSAMSRKGTYNYMAPEVYKGEEYGYAADLYSLGLVLYRFLNDNRTPFLPPHPQLIQYSDREKALNRRMGGEPLPPPTHGDRELQAVVLKACAFSPNERYAGAEALGEALRALKPQEQVKKQAANQTTGQKTDRTARQTTAQTTETTAAQTADREEDALEQTLSVFSNPPREKQRASAGNAGLPRWLLPLAGLVIAALVFIGIGMLGGKEPSAQSVSQSGAAGAGQQAHAGPDAAKEGENAAQEGENTPGAPAAGENAENVPEETTVRIGVVVDSEEAEKETLPYTYLQQRYPTVEIDGKEYEVQLIFIETGGTAEAIAQALVEYGCRIVIDNGEEGFIEGRIERRKELQANGIPVLTYDLGYAVFGSGHPYAYLLVNDTGDSGSREHRGIVSYLAEFARTQLGVQTMLAIGGAPYEDTLLDCRTVDSYSDLDVEKRGINDPEQYTAGLAEIEGILDGSIGAVYMDMGLGNSQRILYSLQELTGGTIPVLTESIAHNSWVEEYGNHVYQAVSDDFWDALGERDTFGPGFRQWLDEDWNRAVAYGVEDERVTDASYFCHDMYVTALQALAMGGDVTQALDTGTFTGLTGSYRFEKWNLTADYGGSQTRYISYPLYSHETGSFIEFTTP